MSVRALPVNHSLRRRDFDRVVRLGRVFQDLVREDRAQVVMANGL